MKAMSRLAVVASVIAALCLAPAAFPKPPPDETPVPGKPGKPKPGKPGKPGAPKPHGVAPVAPGAGAVTPGPVPHRHRPGGPVVIVPPIPPPPPYYRHGYHAHWDYADSSVASVQRALKARGYYGGPVDGDAGSGTRAAIRGFRADNGLGHSSRIDGPLLHALGL